LWGGALILTAAVAGGLYLEYEVAQNPASGSAVKTLLAPPTGPLILLSAGGIGVAMVATGGILMWMGMSE
jgi:hypothetical protein